MACANTILRIAMNRCIVSALKYDNNNSLSVLLNVSGSRTICSNSRIEIRPSNILPTSANGLEVYVGTAFFYE